MKYQIQNIIKLITTFLFFLIISGVIFNSTYFLHTHETAYGNVYMHAHPFNKNAETKNPCTQHKHNKIDLQLSELLDFYSKQYCTLTTYIATFEKEVLSNPYLFFCSNYTPLLTNKDPPLNSMNG